MTVAPDLFDAKKTVRALEIIEKYLLPDKSQLGIRTLSYKDENYNGI